MVIKINQITEALASFEGRYVSSVAQTICDSCWTPIYLATPVAQIVHDWHVYRAFQPHFESYLEDRLHAAGWQHPQAFFEEVQVTCPATGHALSDVNSNESFGFAMDEVYVITNEGACVPHDDAMWFNEDHRPVALSSGWFHSDDCCYVEDTHCPLWFAQQHAARCTACLRWTWGHNADSCGNCITCSAAVAQSQYLGGLSPAWGFRLLPYDDRSSLRLPDQTRKPNRYGIELEILVEDLGKVDSNATRRDIAATHAYYALKCFPDNYVVAKRDGSLYDCGFELVTRPDTYDEMHKTLGDAMIKFSPLLTSTGVYDGEEIQAGLHINMERKGKSHFHLAKMLYFMFALENREFVTAVAGRCCDRYAGFPSGGPCWGDLDNPRPRNGSYKYVAVYVKDKVLEFRLFSSSASRVFVLSCLEFCEALTQFTSYASAQSLTYDEFISFVLAINKFPYLIDRLRNDAAFKPFLQNKTTK